MKEFRINTPYSQIMNAEPEGGENEGENNESHELGGHGNRYSLPYGLCESVGIDTRGMTPREAWDAWTSKTGRTKEDAEREHWGKTAKEKQPAEKSAKVEETTPYKAQKGDTITSGGMKLKIVDVSADGEKILAEILEGKVRADFESRVIKFYIIKILRLPNRHKNIPRTAKRLTMTNRRWTLKTYQKKTQVRKMHPR